MTCLTISALCGGYHDVLTHLPLAGHVTDSDVGTSCMGNFNNYRIYSNKRRGAYLIFPQVRRFFEGGAYSSKYGIKFST